MKKPTLFPNASSTYLTAKLNKLQKEHLKLKQELQPKLGHQQAECLVQGSPAVLHLPILFPCLRSEQLLITVNTHTGSLQAHIPQVCLSAIIPNQIVLLCIFF